MATEKIMTLNASHEATVKAWLRTYLEEHLSWWAQAYGTQANRSLEDLVERDWAFLLKNSKEANKYVVILGDKLPLGIVHCETRIDRYMNIKLGTLGWIYVDEDARGQGISHKLMQAADAWMKTQGAEGREVFVTATNKAAVKLYERFGYQKVDYRMLGVKP